MSLQEALQQISQNMKPSQGYHPLELASVQGEYPTPKHPACHQDVLANTIPGLEAIPVQDALPRLAMGEVVEHAVDLVAATWFARVDSWSLQAMHRFPFPLEVAPC